MAVLLLLMMYSRRLGSDFQSCVWFKGTFRSNCDTITQMKMQNSNQRAVLLWSGDFLALLLLTLIGFGSHNELGVGVGRMLATFVPLAAAWLCVAGPTGLLKPLQTAGYRSLWRVAWAMLLVGPLAAVLRGFWLGSPVVPVFAAVLTGTGALVMLIWRGMYTVMTASRRID